MNNVTISSNQTGIKNGYSGGMVEINNSTISGNADTGLFGESGSTNIVNMSMISGNVGVGCDGYEATLTIDGSTITGNNGGVGMLDGTVTIQNSTISGNTNSGVSATGTAVTISRSTIAENTASGPGGGVYFNAPYGGGSPLTISNSTMSGNTATLGGGVFNHGGALTLTNSTITGNTASSEGGGVYEYYGSVTLNRALISGNVAPIGRESYTYSGFVADHFNLIGYDGDAGVSGYGFTPGPSDIVPSVGIQVSDILDPVLQSNGGNTDTHALVLGSPAIDAAPAADCLAAPISGLDQRGVIRPQGSDCDIGAFELGDEAEIAVSLVVDQDSIDNGSPPNYFSIGDVNDDRAKLGQRRQLRFFEQNVGESIVLHTGEVGDEGWFALTQVPDTWNNAGPTDDGLQNYVGVTQPNGKIKVGKGLGRGNDPEKHLDEVPGVTPLRATGLAQLEGRRVCAVVQDSDVSINYDPLSGSLKGDSLGRVAFEVLLVTELTGYSASSLPKVDIEILDADEVCEGDLELYLDAPQPDSSSEPFDTVPPTES